MMAANFPPYYTSTLAYHDSSRFYGLKKSGLSSSTGVSTKSPHNLRHGQSSSSSLPHLVEKNPQNGLLTGGVLLGIDPSLATNLASSTKTLSPQDEGYLRALIKSKKKSLLEIQERLTLLRYKNEVTKSKILALEKKGYTVVEASLARYNKIQQSKHVLEGKQKHAHRSSLSVTEANYESYAVELRELDALCLKLDLELSEKYELVHTLVNYRDFENVSMTKKVEELKVRIEEEKVSSEKTVQFEEQREKTSFDHFEKELATLQHQVTQKFYQDNLKKMTLPVKRMAQENLELERAVDEQRVLNLELKLSIQALSQEVLKFKDEKPSLGSTKSMSHLSLQTINLPSRKEANKKS